MSFRAKRRNLFGFLEVFPDQPVLSPARAFEAVVQTTTTLAHPPYLPGRNPGHQGIILYVFRHNGTCSDQSASPYRMATHYRAIRAEGSSLTHARTRVNSVHREVRPRSIYIGEYAGRSAEDIVLQLHSVIHGDIILDTDTIPDPDVAGHIHILSQGTVRADDSAALNMAEMPYLGSRADDGSVIHVTAFVNEKVFHTLHPFIQS